ncbi:MAG: uroporphyrinogen-III synthase [Deltaproteobacteria bacterium ADurb.Bin135]|nr:MAG: uroporphyrinogen-III synthase [Deltaproteobacteria bacterium ADurb.Bin135]
MPRAEEARDIIVRFVRDHGGTCDVIPIYRTALPKNIVPLTSKPDIITFTSSSTVKNFVTLYGKKTLGKMVIASIGPVTTKTINSLGLTVHIEAERYDIPGLVEAILEYVKPVPVTHNR